MVLGRLCIGSRIRRNPACKLTKLANRDQQSAAQHFGVGCIANQLARKSHLAFYDGKQIPAASKIVQETQLDNAPFNFCNQAFTNLAPRP